MRIFLDRRTAVFYDLLSLGLGQSSKKVLSYNFEKRGSGSKRRRKPMQLEGKAFLFVKAEGVAQEVGNGKPLGGPPPGISGSKLALVPG